METILEAVRGGNSRECAARIAKISPATLYHYAKLGAEGDPEYAEFSERLREADGYAEAAAVGVLRQAMAEGHVGAAQFWLERRRYQRWGQRRNDKLTIDHPPSSEEQARAELALLVRDLGILSESSDKPS